MKQKVGAVLTALVLMLGIGVAAAAPAQAWVQTVGPFGSLSTCNYQRYQYGLAYGMASVDGAPCWQQVSGTTNKGKWFFYVVHN